MSSIRPIFASLVLIISTVAVAGPREDVKEIASLIEDRYFDAKRATEIANDLRKDADNGVFEPLTDRNDLAVELTERLRKLDGHFSVSWEPTPPAEAPAAERARRVSFDTVDRRSNYGFRKIERLPGNIGYIDLTYVANIDFDRKDSPARLAADAALELVRGSDAVILDLRNNGGGAPSMVGYLVSAFVEPGANVFNVFHSRSDTSSEAPKIAYPNPMRTVPLYVLTSARTGSAAESIAFTLQSCGRAQIVGQRSGGAANPGGQFRTPRGFAVFVSTGSPRNPINGRNWEGDGVKPDVETTTPLARAQELALEKIVASISDVTDRMDAQWALEALRSAARPYASTNLSSYAGTYGPFSIELSANALRVKRGRSEPLTLVPLQEDLFLVEGDPSRRFAFQRTNGAVATLEIRGSNGDIRRISRARAAAKEL